MKNIKCLLGHKRMKLKDVETDTYENDNEKIKTYKCKHCGMIVGGRTLSIKSKAIPFLNNKKEAEAVLNKHDIEIHEYQNWSINNMKNRISILHKKNMDGVIYLVSEDEVSEIEILGITLLVKQSYNIAKGLDVDCKIYRCDYSDNSDIIKPCRYEVEGIRTFKGSTHIGKYGDVKLNNESNIIAIEYHLNKRYDKSGWWKLVHPREFNIEYCCEE